jgi:phosphatidylserine/phosphatidylglycerophosphate/cardiolipin synthase-like enzyme
MNRPRQNVVEQARRLAAEMPSEMIETLADAIEAWHDRDLNMVLAAVPQAYYRALASELLAAWRAAGPEVTPQAVAWALSAAAAAERARREEQSVELVWTGPGPHAVPLRHTEQALLQLIDAAASRLLVVSYAVYKVRRVGEALARAADRGVDLRIVIEAPDRTQGQNVHAALRSLGPAVASRSRVFLWPQERRPVDDAGNRGVLHVKCAVADGVRLFVSSANLTEHAFTLNMELGLLVTGGPLPMQVEAQFDRLIAAGVLAEP